jgi:23S rRNA pseudouridine1911/1915/1917 synthase
VLIAKRRKRKDEIPSMETPTVLFEDKFLVVIYKPPGWITNSADTTTTQPVVEKWIEENYNFPIFENKLLRHGIVHRIDKETSGCLLIAKEEATFFALQKQFKDRIVKKSYLALAHGIFQSKEGGIVASVGRLPWRRDRFGVVAGGRESSSEYKVQEEFRDSGAMFYSLVEVQPKTGRTHQIRIHLKYIGHPIVSDTFYTGRKRAKFDRLWCPRLFLHAHTIAFTHPHTNKPLTIVSELPLDLQQALATLVPYALH